jgi:hypothetical protein
MAIENEKKTAPDASVEAAKEVGADEVQAKFDEAEEQGFFGEAVDETPRENYTVKGVGSGAPTPETDGSRLK